MSRTTGIAGFTARALALGLVAILHLPAPARACCARGWQVCGTATGAGSIDLRFTMTGDTGACTAQGPVTLAGGETAEQVCQALKAELDGNCVGPFRFYWAQPQSCIFTCVDVGSGCWVLIDVENCRACDADEPSATTCCGITVAPFTP